MSKSVSIKVKKILFVMCVFVLFNTASCRVLHKNISYEKFMNLKIGTSYKEIIRKFGKPFSIGNSKNGVKIIYMLKDNNSYVLDFNLWFKLCGMTYGLNDTVFYDNRNPIVFKQEKKNNREDIEQLSIGNTLDQVITEFGEPDIKNELFLIYKFDESKCYKLKFTESLKLMELDVWTDYSIRENEYLDGKRIPLFYDSRID